MSTAITALEQAIWFYDRKDNLDRQGRFDAAVALGEYGVFSSRQIGLILDLHHTYVSKLVNKPEKTGGRFDPAALRPLLRVAQAQARGEEDIEAVKEAFDAGITKYLASRLTGVARTTLERRYARAIKTEGEAA